MEIYIKLFEVLFPVFFVVAIGYYLFYLCYNNDCWFCNYWAFASFFS